MIPITETIAVPGPPERVWEVLSTPSAVVSCVGGAELGAAHDDGSFDGSLVVRFGAVRVRFTARVRLELVEPERTGHLSASGRDGQAGTRFTARATFRVLPDGTGSRVELTGEIQLTGKLAGLIESGAGVVVSRMAEDFSARLVERCAGPGTPAVAPPRPPGLLQRWRAWWSRRWNRRRATVPVADEGGPA